MPTMALEEQHQLIETLQARITEHGPALQQSEALTRYALIDPLLRGLGWDTGDPSQVIPEYPVANGTADYALFGRSTKPAVIIEAKRLGASLGGAIQQVINYCIQDGYEHFAVTDGQHWRLYETNRKGALNDKLIVDLDLKGPVSKTVLDALALWRASVAEEIIRVGVSSVIEVSENSSSDAPAEAQPTKSDDQPLEDGWQSLAGFAPKAGAYPGAVRLPSGTEIDATWWGPFNEAIIRYLSEHGHLTAAHLPIRNSSGSYVLTLKSNPPLRPNGQPLKNLRRVGDYLLNPTFKGAGNVSNARLIIKAAGQDPADFAIKMR